MSGTSANLQRGIRFPWTVRRSRDAEGARPEDTSSSRPTTLVDLVDTSAFSQDIAFCQPAQPATPEIEEKEEVMMSPDKLVPSTTLPEGQPSEPPSNEDLDELANSLLVMQQFVEDLQLEVLKHRQEAEHETRKEWQPRPEYTDLLNAENVQLRQRLIALTGELAEVRTEFEKAKADFEREMTLLREETKTALEEQKKRLYEEREEQLRAFEAERTKWNEERAEMLIEQAKSMASHFESKDRDSTINSEFQKEIYRQITEVQNQANARVAQLQTQIDLLTALPPSSTAVVTALKRPLPGARPTTARSAAADVGPKEPPRWPAPITPRPGLPRPAFGSPRTVPPKCVRPVGVISVSNVPSASCTRLPGGGGGFTSRGQTPAAAAAASASVSIPSPAALCPRAVTPGLPRRTAPVAPIAAVPPVLVVSSAVTHPLLSNADLSDAPEGHTEAPTKAAVKLPNSTWKKASELESGNYTSSDYFKLPGSEQYDGKSVTFSSPGNWLPYDEELTPTEPPDFDTIGFSQLTPDPHLPESPVETPPRKRHLFTMQSGNF
uniref:Uncharacterized protein n=1 Tax=Schistocephalus solidus TaxID=70667 RepID=A0A0X3NLI7_SCHSO